MIWRVSLVGTKEEELVLDDRTAERSAELVLLHFRTPLPGDLQEGIVRIEDVVAEELP